MFLCATYDNLSILKLANLLYHNFMTTVNTPQYAAIAFITIVIIIVIIIVINIIIVIIIVTMINNNNNIIIIIYCVIVINNNYLYLVSHGTFLYLFAFCFRISQPLWTFSSLNHFLYSQISLRTHRSNENKQLRINYE